LTAWSPAGSSYGEFQRRYYYDLPGFVLDCFYWPKGEGPALYQANILSSLFENRRTCVRGPHGLGKTALASWAILHFALTRDGQDWKCITTASAWRQLTKYLWPEVHKWVRRLRWNAIGRAPFDRRRELLQMSLKLNTGEAFAVASDDPSLIEGAHADCLLYIFDEAKVVPGATFDAAEGAFAGTGRGEAYALAISTPGEPNGRFYDIQTRKPGYEDWAAIHVTLEDAIDAGRVPRDWAEQRKRQWGETSAVYQNRVLGEFASSREDGLVPLAWLEQANDRWREWDDAGRPGELKALGVDVGRGGDKSTIAEKWEWMVEGQPPRYAIAPLYRDGKPNTMSLTGRVAALIRKWTCSAAVDVIGIGAGVVDRLGEMGLSVFAFNASARADGLDRAGLMGFANKRSQGWWSLRELLDPDNGEWVALPPDDLLTGDLTAPHWRIQSGGKIAVESKDDIRKRIGRSTDDGDAVMMAFQAPADNGLFAWEADKDGGDDDF